MPARDEGGDGAVGALEIPGAPCNPYREIESGYSYATDKTKCPNCGGLGVPWGGWFHCYQSCGCIAVVADGRAFVPTNKDLDTVAAAARRGETEKT